MKIYCHYSNKVNVRVRVDVLLKTDVVCTSREASSLLKTSGRRYVGTRRYECLHVLCCMITIEEANRINFTFIRCDSTIHSYIF